MIAQRAVALTGWRGGRRRTRAAARAMGLCAREGIVLWLWTVGAVGVATVCSLGGSVVLTGWLVTADWLTGIVLRPTGPLV